ncbi:hypothetical protein [Sphingomonas sp.]|jgi:hypothetical protein|uniref:hypothetical protein n=1 Tax=Sphingomonas sp. TaxID=28214 RepID=UPI002ED80801
MRLILAASAFVLAAAPGLAGPEGRETPIATPSGEPVSCVTIGSIKETRVRDGATIDFIMRSGKVFRNALDGGSCPQLASQRRFLYKASGSQLCWVDRISVLVDPGLSRGASCGLGQFQPITLSR